MTNPNACARLASKGRHEELAAALAAIACPSERSRAAQNALGSALRRQRPACAKAAIAAGASLNGIDADGLSPLGACCAAGVDHYIPELAAAGADPDLPMPGGLTALGLAASLGECACVIELLKAGASCLAPPGCPPHSAALRAKGLAHPAKMLAAYEAEENLCKALGKPLARRIG